MWTQQSTHQINGHEVEILLRQGRTTSRDRYIVKINGDTDWTEYTSPTKALSAAKSRCGAKPAATTVATTPPSGWSYASGRRSNKVHREMEMLTGVPSTAASRGVCHYCGLPTDRRGYCAECR